MKMCEIIRCKISILTILVFYFHGKRLVAQLGIEPKTFAVPGLHATTQPQLSLSYIC